MALTVTAIPWTTETSSTQLISFRFLIIIISVVFPQTISTLRYFGE